MVQIRLLSHALLASDSCPDNGVNFAIVCMLSTNFRGILTSNSCPDNDVDVAWYAHFPLNVGASLRAIPVLTMALMSPWFLPNLEAAAASVGISPVFNSIWLATLLNAPWLPLLPNSEAAATSVGILFSHYFS
jgi:hypothetical protein